jgi:hypothetical protein
MSMSSELSDLYPAIDHSRASSKTVDKRPIAGVTGPLNVLALHSFQMDQLIKKNKESKPALAILGTDFLACSHQSKTLSCRITIEWSR